MALGLSSFSNNGKSNQVETVGSVAFNSNSGEDAETVGSVASLLNTGGGVDSFGGKDIFGAPDFANMVAFNDVETAGSLACSSFDAGSMASFDAGTGDSGASVGGGDCGGGGGDCGGGGGGFSSVC